MKKRMVIMLIIMGLLFGGIFGFQIFKAKMIKNYLSHNKAPVITVSTIKAQTLPWQPRLSSVGTLRAVQGVDVTTEVAGLVRSLHFKSGDDVAEAAVLMQLNADNEVAALHAAEAAAALAEITLKRDKAQLKARAVSQATVDNDEADLKSKQAQVEQQKALVEKKSISAPFAGKLGITLVNPGQYLNAGDKVVSLQSLNPIYIDFTLPQQYVSRIQLDQVVTLHADAFPNTRFTGKVAAIDPKIDPATRNVQIEALIENPKAELLPGMFANVDLETGQVESKLTVPQTAISFNPYGATLYLVEETPTKEGKTQLTAKQAFVNTGESRGDQVEILSGLKEGDTVITSGQLKLKNGSAVAINNEIVPSNDVNPKPVDE